MRNETKSVGGIVLNKDEKVLVVNQHGSSWSLPKGHIEDGESLLDTAKREIYEESGITEIKLLKNLGSYQRYKLDSEGKEDKSELKTIHMFLFSTETTKLKPIDPENPQAKWVDVDKVSKLLTHPLDKKFFEDNIKIL